MFGSEFGEDFAVKLKIILFYLCDEGGVRLVAVLADCGIEADNPELAEVSLFISAVGERVSAGAHKSLVRVTLLLGTNTAIAFCSLQNILTAFLCHHTSFDSCHMKLVSRL